MSSKGNQVCKKVLVAFLFLISTACIPAYSTNEEESNEIKWEESTYWEIEEDGVEKDLLYPPITAYIESSVLYIRNDKPEGALDIAIVSGKSGRVVWEQVVPEAATSLVTIPLDALPAGEYTLQVANEWGGYLCGSFRK